MEDLSYEYRERQEDSLGLEFLCESVALDPLTYGYRWNYDLVSKTDSANGPLATLPEYFKLVEKENGKSEWVTVDSSSVPMETGLTKVEFKRSTAAPAEPYVTPDEVASSWKKPGPAAGPFESRLGDGSVVTYYWYRFADQPALLNADLSDAEREDLQKRAEKLHQHWTKDREYLSPPNVGKLADLDPAVMVTPPKGLEIGYVPIVTRQGVKD